MIPSRCDVLIIGAGPAGLALALTLARSGVMPVIVERKLSPQTTSRAAVIHAHTLEILDRIGVGESLIQEGLKIQKFALRDRDRLLGLVRFDALPARHRHLLMLPQDRTEAILLEALARAGVTVVRGVEFQALSRRPDGIDITLQHPGGSQVTSARYLVGADGMHSAVRDACNIPFDGSQYEDAFVLADVSIPEIRDEVSLYFSPEGLMVVAPLPQGRYRIVATVEGNAPEQPDAAFMQSLLDSRGPGNPPLGRIGEVTWSSRFHLHHRLARRYREGRVFLVGDAAHVHSPAGGQGMNTGLVDAYTLGVLLQQVLSGSASEAVLDRYEHLRRPAAAQVLGLADRLTRLATLARPWQRRLRNYILPLVLGLPMVRRRLALNLSGIARRSATLTADDKNAHEQLQPVKITPTEGYRQEKLS